MNQYNMVLVQSDEATFKTIRNYYNLIKDKIFTVQKFKVENLDKLN